MERRAAGEFRRKCNRKDFAEVQQEESKGRARRKLKGDQRLEVERKPGEARGKFSMRSLKGKCGRKISKRGGGDPPVQEANSRGSYGLSKDLKEAVLRAQDTITVTDSTNLEQGTGKFNSPA